MGTPVKKGFAAELDEVTFIIPVRFDSEERLRNCRMLLAYLLDGLGARVFLGEHADRSYAPRFMPEYVPRLAEYIMDLDDSPYFHRTSISNRLARWVTTPYLVNLDADLIVPPEQYLMALEAMKRHGAGLVRPFDGRVYDLSNPAMASFYSDLDCAKLPCDESLLRYTDTPGGAMLLDRAKYAAAGLDNENCISYGYEDDERIFRMTKLGHTYLDVPGPAFHFPHPRGVNSDFQQNPYNDANRAEAEKVRDMDRAELEEYIRSWPWYGQAGAGFTGV